MTTVRSWESQRTQMNRESAFKFLSSRGLMRSRQWLAFLSERALNRQSEYEAGYPVAAMWLFVSDSADNTRMRNGLSTRNASSPAIQSKAIASMKTGSQFPVLLTIRLAIGTSRDAVPLAVYSKP